MHYVYHPEHEPKVVTSEEYQSYLDNGWYDSPAKFPHRKKKKNEMADLEQELAQKEKERDELLGR